MDVATHCPLANHLLGDPGQLRARIDQEGYLFLRGVFDRDLLASIRRQCLELLREAGLLAADAPVDEARPAMGRDDVPGYVLQAVQRQLFGLEDVHAFWHSRPVLDLFGTLIGEPVVPHVHKQVRVQFPEEPGKPGQVTAAHQDFVFNQGTTDVYTCWVPLGDVSREAGGLQVVPGSHKHGVHDVHAATPGSITLSIRDEDLTGSWIGPDYALGDAIVFHSLTVHRAPPNRGRAFRISTDCRYQAVSQPFSEKLLEPLPGVVDAYPRWRSQELKFYWRTLGLKTVEHDMRYLEKADAEAIERGLAGDQSVRTGLLNIVRSPMADPVKKEGARRALEHLDRSAAR